MEEIVDLIPPTNFQLFSPGVVGSVGDILTATRLKQSAPDMAMRYSTSAKDEMMMGSNVQDGDSISYSGGGGPITIKPPHDLFLRNVGWRQMDLAPTDRMMTTIQGSLGNYSWRNKLAQTIETLEMSKHGTGTLFQPLPGPYQPTGLTRGNQYPRIIDVIGPADNSTPRGDQRPPPPEVPGNPPPEANNQLKRGTPIAALCTRKNGRRERKPIPGRGA